jgi:hypothetical protein
MMNQESQEGFLVPITPTKRIKDSSAPDSPAKARLRLGSLLSEIREGFTATGVPGQSTAKNLTDTDNTVHM